MRRACAGLKLITTLILLVILLSTVFTPILLVSKIDPQVPAVHKEGSRIIRRMGVESSVEFEKQPVVKWVLFAKFC